MFPGAHNLVFNNSQFIDQQADGGPTGIDILREVANPDAAYDSSARDPPPSCYPGTREQYIGDIIYWALPAVGADDPLPLFWMKGPAGVGKSAVAQTCVERLKDMGKLGAAFFFAVKKRDRAAELFPTIIYQLSSEFPDYRDLVNQRIRRDRTILNKTMATQFQILVVEPLQELEKRGSRIGKRVAIFIDGIDECEDKDAQCEIIKIIAGAARDKVTPFCWAFFSRPESHIEGTFAIDDIAKITYTTLLPISRDTDGDIELYLRGGFENILRRRNINLGSQWPSNDDIRALVHAANGLFIYVATALRVVAQPGSLPEESLRAILTTGCEPAAIDAPSSPFAELDAFYTLIMQRIPPEILPAVLLFLHELCSSPPSSGPGQPPAVIVSNLLGFSELTFKTVRNQLSAVIHVQDQDEPLPTRDADTSQPFQFANRDTTRGLRYFVITRLGGSILFYHKSFYDFLIDSRRSGPFHTGSSASHNAQFKRYVELHLKYQESYLFQGSELVLTPGGSDSASSLSHPYTNELVNSIIKAELFGYRHRMCLSRFVYPGIDPYLMQQFQHADFRKYLYVETSLSGTAPPYPALIWECQGHIKMVSRTVLFQHPSHDLWSFVPHFKQLVERLRRAGIIHPYYPSSASLLTLLSLPNFRDQSTSGIYRMGHETKSIYWYWEIDFESGCYREFRTIDLAEGERIYREQQFDSWVQ
ncbi:hypothetical protein P691DRAFT_778467 [Macrolepiota fuliginosa MF-IS2]|uniref:Nephrocystin 3-like N-terminal domain-containing protein n=1 Tax=Macrolepiota fuliginosa MF-IS2 TaxID=1400762 RepID=A0A9P5X507_9AGAR|nr:hypothetical protein P691DRAFT_778467 [Macrolepiota fuliginosa MF-IS2]